MTDDALIDALGGTGEVAKRFGVSDGAVSLWRKRGIPRSWHHEIWMTCQALGIAWTPPQRAAEKGAA